jgi:hypothetical protein
MCCGRLCRGVVGDEFDVGAGGAVAEEDGWDEAMWSLCAMMVVETWFDGAGASAWTGGSRGASVWKSGT